VTVSAFYGLANDDAVFGRRYQIVDGADVVRKVDCGLVVTVGDPLFVKGVTAQPKIGARMPVVAEFFNELTTQPIQIAGDQ